MDLRTKIVFAMVGVSLLGLLALGAVAYTLTEQRLTDRTERQLRALAEARYDDVSDLFQGWRDRVALIAGRSELARELVAWEEGDVTAPLRLRDALTEAMAASDMVTAVTVWDASGRRVARASEGPEIPGTPGTWDALPREPGDSIVLLGVGELNADAVDYLAPLQRDGRRVGTLGVSLSTAHLLEVAGDTTGMGRTGETMVVARDEDGEIRVLTSLRHAADDPAPLDAAAGGELARRAFAGEQGPFRQGVVDYRDEPVWATTRQIPEAGLGLVVKVDSAEELEPVREFRSLILGAGLSLSGFAILLGILLGLHFARPIHELAEVADRFRHGDLTARADPDREDELGLLARAFNEMGEELESRMAQLLQYKRFFDMSPDLLCVAGTDGYFKRINPAFMRALGWTEAELLAEPFVAFVHADDVDKTIAETARLARGEPTINFENRFRLPTGGYQTLNWTCQPVATGELYAVARKVGEPADG